MYTWVSRLDCGGKSPSQDHAPGTLPRLKIHHGGQKLSDKTMETIDKWRNGGRYSVAPNATQSTMTILRHLLRGVRSGFIKEVDRVSDVCAEVFASNVNGLRPESVAGEFVNRMRGENWDDVSTEMVEYCKQLSPNCPTGAIMYVMYLTLC